MRSAWVAGLVAAVALVAAGVAYALLAPPAHLSAYRDGPEDLGTFREAVEGRGYGTASIGVSPHAVSALGDPSRVVVVVAGVERPYRPGEIEALVGFVDGGGTLMVADDFGFANALADRFGVNYDKLQLFDANYEVNASLVAVRGTLGEDAYALVLNVPTGLSVRPRPQGEPQPRVLAVTSEAAYLDANANGVKDEADVQGATVVAVEVPYGDGVAVFLGDPAPFTGGMLPRGDNEEFLLDVVATRLGDGGGVVVFDESRHTTNPVAAVAGQALEALVVATHEGAFRWLALGTLALAAGLWLRLRRREEPLGHHVGRLDEPVRVRPAADGERLRALARSRLVAVHGLAPDAAPEAYREAATDPVVGRLAAGDDGLNIQEDLDALLARIERYGRVQAPAGATPGPT